MTHRLTVMAGLTACLACAHAADMRARDDTPFLVIREGRAGFIAHDGRLLAPPRYARCGSWREGRIWVQEHNQVQTPGLFLDTAARPASPPDLRDLSAVRPEQPLPEFDDGLAVVGLADGGFGYLDRNGHLIGRTTPAGAFQRQTGDRLIGLDAGRIGFVDRQGRFSIAARFAEATPFRGGRAGARTDERWGLIDETGAWLQPPAYDAVWWLPDTTNLWAYRNGKRWGLLDRSGRRLTPPDYDGLGLADGRAVSVRVDDRWGLVRADGSVALPPRFADLQPLEGSGGDWAAQSDAGLWGVVSATGAERIPCRFERIEATWPDRWLAWQDGHCGLIHPTNGQWIAAGRYQRLLPFAPPLQRLARIEQQGLWGVLDIETGREWLAPRQARIEPWLGLIAVEAGGTTRLMTAQGADVSSWGGGIDGLPTAEAMRDGYGLLRTTDGFTWIEAGGTLPLAERFQDVGAWSEGLLPASHGGRWGFADRRGNWAIKPRFDAARPFAEGFAPVREQERWGLADRKGRLRVAPAYEALGAPWKGLVPARLNGRWGLIGTDGRVRLPFDYDGIEWGDRDGGASSCYGFDPPFTPGLDSYGR